ncbi:hypothetical protein [Edwardsiella tarda]|uniref:hypothetical protein n=1 Tax=Edwardsiella tarda TaxID=636 RepID=UPI00083B9416|nr:hypothetical protein [Edwardsiella tarda]
MANVSISLSANTSAYIERIKKAKSDTDRNIIKMEQRIDQFANSVSQNMTSVGGAINGITGAIRGVKFGGFIAGGVATSLAAVSVVTSINQMTKALVQAQGVLEKTAQYSRMSIDELKRASGAFATVGIDMEKFGDLAKDLNDKIGDYMTAGTGPFQDFFDVIKTGSAMSIADLKGLSTIDAYKKIVSEMEAVGASYEQVVWVMEGLGDEAASLAPLLMNGAKEYERMADRMNRTTINILGTTKEDIQSLDATMKATGENFTVFMTESLREVTRGVDGFFLYVNNKFAEMGKESIGENYIKDFKDGNVRSVDSFVDSRATLAELAVIDNAISVSQELAKDINYAGPSTEVAERARRLSSELDGLQKRRAQLLKLSQQQAAAEAATGTKNVEGDGYAAGISAATAKEATAHKERETMLQKANASRLAGANAALNVMRATTEEDRAHWDGIYKQEQKNVIRFEELANNALSNAEAAGRERVEAIRKQQDDELAVQIKFAGEKEKIALETQQKIRDSEKELAKNPKAYTQAMHNDFVKRAKEEEAKQLKELEEKQTKDAKKESDERIKLTEKGERDRLELAVMIATDGVGRMKAQYELDKYNLEKSLRDKGASQAEHNKAMEKLDKEHKENLARNQLEQKMKFASTEAERVAIGREMQLQELGNEDEARGRKAELHRQWAEEDRNKLMSDFMSTQALELMNAQMAAEQLEEQRKQKLIGDEEYAKQKLAIDQRVSDAKTMFAQAELDNMAAVLEQTAQNLEQGTAAQRAAFLASKAAAIASMTVNMGKAWSNVDSDPSLPTTAAKAIAKTAIGVQYGAQLASVAATTIGQFHGGSDEVKDTGSYILKRGERIVQPEANKDLTNFLSGNQNKGSGVTVDAPLNIQGDTSISEDKLAAMMAKQRDHIAKVVRLAQKENPSLR